MANLVGYPVMDAAAIVVGEVRLNRGLTAMQSPKEITIPVTHLDLGVMRQNSGDYRVVVAPAIDQPRPHGFQTEHQTTEMFVANALPFFAFRNGILKIGVGLSKVMKKTRDAQVAKKRLGIRDAKEPHP